MRRALTHPLAPLVGCVLGGIVYLVLAPATADMAAHDYRTWLFRQEGLTVWNAQWYGGHHVLGYSLLFAPVASLLSPAVVGVLSAVVAVAVFARLAQAHAPSPTAAAVGTWLFVGGVLSNVAIGRMPFLLGIALAVGAWACGEGGGRLRAAGTALLALASVLASPVAGAFLIMVAAAVAIAREGRRALWLLAIPALCGGVVLWALFPEGGSDRFTATAFWPMLVLSAAALALIAPGRRALWAAGMLYLAVLVGAFVVPTPFGQNALRLGVLLGPSVLVLAHRGRAPILAIAVVALGLLYLQWLPAVRAVAEAHGDPSTRPAFQAEARRYLTTVVQPGERIEVPLTKNHWEASDLAKVFPLARGWERQLDQKANPLFYASQPLTAARYHAWLRRTGVRWVALANAPLDYSARAEARVLERGASFLKLRYSSRNWRVWEVRGVDPPATDGARVLAAGPNWFEVDASRPTVVRQRYTRYWRADGACIRATADGWTKVEPTPRTAEAGGVLLVTATFALRTPPRQPDCEQ